MISYDFGERGGIGKERVIHRGTSLFLLGDTRKEKRQSGGQA